MPSFLGLPTEALGRDLQKPLLRLPFLIGQWDKP